MYIICLHIKFHISSFTGTLVITVKLKAKESLCTDTTFYILDKNIETKVAYILNIYYYTPFRTLVPVFTMLLLLIMKWSGFQWHNIHTEFHDGHTHKAW